MINRAKFLQNGKCGYLLKPGFMLTNEKYNLKEETEDKKVIKIQIFVYFISRISPIFFLYTNS